MDLILALIVIGIAVGALTGITGSSGVLIVVPASLTWGSASWIRWALVCGWT
ncbi:hypothetical protein [Metallosphaera hakonensis]|uniref:hypothetical protein n=1 Tax=Metallosphaera hakonensis TaxID=79601 RepID=UPI0020928412|nr:hypothetical protein [Metallosphaera hakonensis]